MATEENPQILGVGPHVAAFLRLAYPRHRAKRIAREFGVSPKTAERWLAGAAPTIAHVEAMVACWGARFLAAVFPEAFTQRDRRIAELEAELARSPARTMDAGSPACDLPGTSAGALSSEGGSEPCRLLRGRERAVAPTGAARLAGPAGVPASWGGWLGARPGPADGTAAARLGCLADPDTGRYRSVPDPVGLPTILHA
jgi:hypothetical protein